MSADGTVLLTGSDVEVAPGDVTVKALNTGTANLSAANTLSLVESQVTTAKDLTLSALGTVAISDGDTSPVMVKAGGSLTVTGNQGIDIITLNTSAAPALQSGGDLKLSSDGLINVDAALLSGGNLSFLNLTGGAGNLVNNDQTSLQSKGVVNLGNYTGVSLKVEADGNIRGGDFTITGRKRAGVAQSDPDFATLTQHPTLILRAGLKDPVSIISVGNVTARGGIVDFSTNGNIFTGNIDVSPDTPIPIYGTGQQRITLKGYNIFTGNLNAGSDIAPGTYTMPSTPTYDPRCYGSDLSDYLGNWVSCGPTSPQTISVPSGSISLDATQYLRTGNIDASSRTANGGNVTIQASDAIVGSINASGSTDIVQFDGRYYGGSVYSYSPSGGDITVKTDTPFQHGAITVNGARQGTVSIGARETLPSTGGSGGIDLQDLPSLAKPKDADTVRQNVLTLMAARRLAGKKMTAQEIADKLGLSIEEAEIAVLSPIGDEIKVDTPDLSRLSQNGTKNSSAAALAFPLAGTVIFITAGLILYFSLKDGIPSVKARDVTGKEIWEKTGDAAKDLLNKYLPNIFPSSQRGRGNQADSGILAEALERVQEGVAKDLTEALNQLRKEAKQSNNGKGDPEREARIRKTQKATQDRPSRETKDKKK